MNAQCWICEGKNLVKCKANNIPEGITSQSFAITDSTYGVTTELVKCQTCGFIQSSEKINLVDFYKNLEDPGYEANRKERSLQAKKILLEIQKVKTGGRLLDIGAGSGMLVEQALALGFVAEGVEPSQWLQRKAVEHGLPVKLGIFPHPELSGPYNIVTLIDVIEHVDDPVGLLKAIANGMANSGIIAVITPDVGSMVAKILGYHWWHFRVAHVGYFNKKTLHMALGKAGFEKVNLTKAKWYFAADYLLQRINTYLPKFLRLPPPKFLQKWTVPLNLGDSMFAIYKKI